ncbi:hypothetical protein SAMN06265360_11493 [Haloechinothrix alba]|uniref:Uncharacterized protein n=1 Tax=Haloechinothrix alba TaxID=664784 RepID=A0A238YAQ4_9PSEU|nr:hypothetical protein [Haloechinothrix alba]SNR68042.1 hypothetical protein SAMN06265360_11493 [Haloechinothrix alba]
MSGDKPGRHDGSRDGHGEPQPEKWTNAGNKDDGDKHDKDEK